MSASSYKPSTQSPFAKYPRTKGSFCVVTYIIIALLHRFFFKAIKKKNVHVYRMYWDQTVDYKKIIGVKTEKTLAALWKKCKYII